jgi:Rieske Fe-S protein
LSPTQRFRRAAWIRAVDRDGGRIADVRTRVLVALAVSVVLFGGTVLVVSMSTSGHRHDASVLVTLNVAGVHPGDVLTTRYTASLPPLKSQRLACSYAVTHACVANRHYVHRVPVFVVDVPDEGIVALVGRSTHLGCRVQWIHAARYQRFEHHPEVTFEDPCGGSLFALNGDCLGGPCPRGLDRFSATASGMQLRVNLRKVVLGRKREPTAQLNPD